MFSGFRFLRIFAYATRNVINMHSPHETIGGQAIIEGVMMRSPTAVSWAVRRSSGDITVETMPFVPASKRYRLLKLPVIRGAVSLYESLALGLKALSRSAELASEVETTSTKTSFKDKIGIGLSMVIAFAISFVVFLYAPMKILSFFVPEESAFLFNILAGVIRVFFLIAYMLLISLMKDIRRVFEYHGAEHKAIRAHEAGMKLTVDNMKPYSTHHPRCGTSFLLIAALICVFLFAVADAIIITLYGPYPSVIVRVLVHLALLPVVSGASYEVLRYSSSRQSQRLVRIFVAPGLWLQRITTREPDDSQLVVAASALEAVL